MMRGLADEEGGDLEGDVAAEEVAQLGEAGEGVGLDLGAGGDEGGVDGLADLGGVGGVAGATLERGSQLADLDRLADVVVHAGGEAGLAVAVHRVGGHGDDARLTLEVLADPPGGLEAVHLGHLHVHEDDVVGVAADGLEGLEAVEGVVGAVAEALEDQEDELLVGGVVLDGEDAQREALAHGGVELAAARARLARLGRAATDQQLQEGLVELRGLDRLADEGGALALGLGVAAAERGEEDGGGGVAVQLLQDAEVAVLGQEAVDEADVDVAAVT